MLCFNQAMLQDYLADDPILELLQRTAQPVDGEFVSHRWLLDSPAKRLIFQSMYGELLRAERSAQTTVLDVGGGYTALTRTLLRHCQYQLLDIMAHDCHETLGQLQQTVGREFWVHGDWHDDPAALRSTYDLIVANDIFPNVDQRLGPFVERYAARCHEMRILLTYYNTPRWYQVKRVDGEEIFHMLAWDGAAVRRALQPHAHRVLDADWEMLEENPPSLYANQRQVCLIRLRGDA